MTMTTTTLRHDIKTLITSRRLGHITTREFLAGLGELETVYNTTLAKITKQTFPNARRVLMLTGGLN